MEWMRLPISNIDLIARDDREFKVCKMGDFYLTRIIRAANDLGLKGKKIKEIVLVDTLPTGGAYIDFVCEGREDSHG